MASWNLAGFALHTSHGQPEASRPCPREFQGLQAPPQDGPGPRSSLCGVGVGRGSVIKNLRNLKENHQESFQAAPLVELVWGVGAELKT